jgi:hypothetical protein
MCSHVNILAITFLNISLWAPRGLYFSDKVRLTRSQMPFFLKNHSPIDQKLTDSSFLKPFHHLIINDKDYHCANSRSV